MICFWMRRFNVNMPLFVVLAFFIGGFVLSSYTQQQQQWQKMSKRECGGKLE